MENPQLVAVGVVLAVVFVLSVISQVVASAGQMTAAPPEVAEAGSRMLKAATRAALLAEQHRNCVLALAEISAAKAYARALRVLMTDGEITAAFHTDVRRLLADIEVVEQSVFRKISSKAPRLIPAGRFSASTGWVP